MSQPTLSEKETLQKANQLLTSLLASITWKGKPWAELTHEEQMEVALEMLPPSTAAAKRRSKNVLPPEITDDSVGVPKCLDNQTLKEAIIFATTYRSGEDSCGSVYMGGMAHSKLKYILHKGYVRDRSGSLEGALAQVDRDTLLEAYEHVVPYIRAALKHGTRHCPCCASIL